MAVAANTRGWREAVLRRTTWAPRNLRLLPRGIAIFATEHEMRRNDTRILLKYYAPGHTDSDISVYFTDADVVHVGDTWWNGVYPFIDYSTGGSIDGSIRAAEANAAAGARARGRPIRCRRISRHARDNPGERSCLEETRQDFGRDHRRQTNLHLRREMGTVPDHPGNVHGSRLYRCLTNQLKERKLCRQSQLKMVRRFITKTGGKGNPSFSVTAGL